MTTTTTIAAALIMNASFASAAPIDWGTPFELVSDADLDLSGDVVYAINGGDNTGNEAFISDPSSLGNPIILTAQGKMVPFEGIEAVYGDDAFFGQIGFPFETFGDAIDHLPGEDFNATFDVTDFRTAPFPQVSFDPLPFDLFDPVEERNYQVPTGNAVLDVILNSVVFYDGRAVGESALNITLRNLTPGQDYRVQLIGAADGRDRPDQIPTDTVNDGEGNSVSGLAAFADVDGDGVSHVTTVIGEFTANSETQAINVVLEAGRNGGIAALILTTPADTFLCADQNGDGTLTGADFNAFLTNFSAGDSKADINQDGSLTGADFNGWLTAFSAGDQGPECAL